MATNLKQRFTEMTSFLPNAVELFICSTGLDKTIDFLPAEYDNYKVDDENALYCSPKVFAQVLIRLKPFFGITNFTTYPGELTQQTRNTHNFLSTFFDVCSIKPVTSTITNNSNNKTDIAYVTSNFDINELDNIIKNTNNAIIVEDINRDKIIQKLPQYKPHNVISYYFTEGTNNPVSSAMVIYKNFAMFE